MDYITEAQLFEYMENKRNEQITLESYINECVILSEAKTAIHNLKVFNEEEKKSGWERIKEAFKKFGEFIKRIFAKFFDKMSRFVNGNKKWLDKHKAIILNNPFKFENVTMYNYPVGIKRMVNSAIPAFTDYETMKSNLESDKKCYDWMAKSIGYDKFSYAEGVNFTESVANYFRGGESTMEFSAAKLNMADIFNYCYEYEKMDSNIRKDRDVLLNGIAAVTKAIDKKAASLSADTSSSSSSSAENKEKEPPVSATTPPTEPGKENKDGDKTKSEAAVFSNVYSRYITEADGVEIGNKKDEADNPSGVQMKANQSSGVSGDKDATASTNMKNVDYNGKDSSDIQNKNVEDVEKVNDGAAIKEMSENCSRYKAAASGVFSAKLTVAEKCYKDYMKILIAHVDSYIGRQQNNDKTTDVATDYRNSDTYKNAPPEAQKEVDEAINVVVTSEEILKAKDNADLGELVRNRMNEIMKAKSEKAKGIWNTDVKTIITNIITKVKGNMATKNSGENT